jgi:hypothetical protein
MPGTDAAGSTPTFLTLPSEIRCMIYKEVFARARIVLPAPDAPRRSSRLTSKLPALLPVCRQVHLEASPILYSCAIVEVLGYVATKTVHQALENQDFQKIRTLFVDVSSLQSTLGSHPKTRFATLTKLIVKTRPCASTILTQRRSVIQEICRTDAKTLRRSQAKSGIDWSADRGFSIHIQFELHYWVPLSRVTVSPLIHMW